MRTFAAWLFLLVSQCTPAVSPVNPDSGDGSVALTCTGACANLAQLNCPEALQSLDCAATFQMAQDQKLVREASGQPMTCADVARATSVAAVRALGVSCVGP